MGDKDISLSVEESNALRKKLGLSLLREDDDNDKDGVKPGASSLANDVLVAPVLPGEKERTDELRSKLEARKGRREIDRKLKKVKTLGEEEEVDDTVAWVKRSRELAKAKEEAAKRERELEEQESAMETAAAYTSSDLAGLKVAHDQEHLGEGQTILTLQDRGILDEDGDGDVLQNVNLADDERTKDQIAKAKKDLSYKAYTDDGDNASGVLAKYDDVDDQTGDFKETKKKTFTIGSEGSVSAEEKLKQEVKERLALSLDGPTGKLGSDFYTEEEMVQFKKKKGKKKGRKTRKKKDGDEDMVKADDLMPLAEEPASAVLGARAGTADDATDNDLSAEAASSAVAAARSKASASVRAGKSSFKKMVKLDTSALMDVDEPLAHDDQLDLLGGDVGVDDAEMTAEADLQRAIARARRLRKNKPSAGADHVTKIAESITVNEDEDENEGGGAGGGSGGLVFSAMSEFVRNVGDDDDDDDKHGGSKPAVAPPRPKPAVVPVKAAISASSARPKKETKVDDMSAAMMEDDDNDVGEEEHIAKDSSSAGASQPNADELEHPIQEEEIVTNSVAAFLKLAAGKGYIETADGTSTKELRAKAAASAAAKPNDLLAKSAQVESSSSRDDSRRRRDSRDYRDRDRDRDRDDRGRRDDRDRERSDPFSIPGYNPNPIIEYRDESGNKLNEKEAFRFMSHAFHGKGSGKNKVDKRLRRQKQAEEVNRLMSADQAHGTMGLLKRKQDEFGTAHVVLNASKLLSSAPPPLAKRSRKDAKE